MDGPDLKYGHALLVLAKTVKDPNYVEDNVSLLLELVEFAEATSLSRISTGRIDGDDPESESELPPTTTDPEIMMTATDSVESATGHGSAATVRDAAALKATSAMDTAPDPVAMMTSTDPEIMLTASDSDTARTRTEPASESTAIASAATEPEEPSESAMDTSPDPVAMTTSAFGSATIASAAETTSDSLSTWKTSTDNIEAATSIDSAVTVARETGTGSAATGRRDAAAEEMSIDTVSTLTVTATDTVIREDTNITTSTRTATADAKLPPLPLVRLLLVLLVMQQPQHSATESIMIRQMIPLTILMDQEHWLLIAMIVQLVFK